MLYPLAEDNGNEGLKVPVQSSLPSHLWDG
jgi:hypothetical protein